MLDKDGRSQHVLAHVPIVDLSDFEERKAEVAEQLHDAAVHTGFFYVTGHGISGQLIDEVFAAGFQFMDLHNNVKEKYSWVPDRYLGWRSPTNIESVTGNRLWEWFSFGRYGVGGYDVRQQKFLGERWPSELGEEWKQLSLKYQAQVHGVALKLLRALAISLGRDEHEFEEPFDINHEENPSFMAWNWYPPVDEDTSKLPPRLHAHADMVTPMPLTVFNRDTGLEIAPGKDVDTNPELDKLGNAWNAVPTAKHWTPVDPIEGAFTVNLGDGLAWWTDGLFRSTYHRVRVPTGSDSRGARMSVPYFVNPNLNFKFQGPEKKFPPLTGFDLLAKTGNAYEARKNDSEGKWRKEAYMQAHEDGAKLKAQSVAA